MKHFYDWGITLRTDHPENLEFDASDLLFFAMCEYFETPEREEYQVTRSELEEYIREERAFFSRQLGVKQSSLTRQLCEDDCEWIDFVEFLRSSKQEHFWLYAWW